MWVGEDEIERVHGVKHPDAILVDEQGATKLVIEFGGDYSAERVEKFHSFCVEGPPHTIYGDPPMDVEVTKSIRLTTRDAAIIEHVKRYHLTTIQVLKKLFFVEGTTDNAVVKVTLRLRRAGYLVDHQLYGPYSYFVLGPTADPSDKDAGTALRGQPLVTSYAMLMLCCMSDIRRAVVPYEDLARIFTWYGLDPSFAHPNLAFYLDKPEGYAKARIVFVRVDHGSDWRHLLKKVYRVERDWGPRRGFSQLVKERLFAIVLATGSEKKRKKVQQHSTRTPSTESRSRPSSSKGSTSSPKSKRSIDAPLRAGALKCRSTTSSRRCSRQTQST